MCYTVPGNQMGPNQHNLNIKSSWKHHLIFNFYIPPEDLAQHSKQSSG